MTLPPVPDPFYWAPLSLGPVLRCRALDGLASHAFTTRQQPLITDADWRAVGDVLGVERVTRVRQVHGRAVVVCRAGEVVASDAEGDVLITNDPNGAVAVRVADCVPVLLADRRTGAVAAVHAGWRGTAAGAVSAAVEAMRLEFGTAPDDLIAAIGPSIGLCCYEVGSELVDAFAAAGHARHLIDRWFRTKSDAATRFRAPGGAGLAKLHLDVPGANRDQLILAGVPEAQIHMCGLCTAMHLDVLTSFRVERDRAGRLAAVIRPATPPYRSGAVA